MATENTPQAEAEANTKPAVPAGDTEPAAAPEPEPVPPTRMEVMFRKVVDAWGNPKKAEDFEKSVDAAFEPLARMLEPNVMSTPGQVLSLTAPGQEKAIVVVMRIPGDSYFTAVFASGHQRTFRILKWSEDAENPKNDYAPIERHRPLTPMK